MGRVEVTFQGSWSLMDLFLGSDKEPGINGAIMRRQQPASTVVNTVDVPNPESYIKRITTNGGKVVMPKTQIPGVGYFAYCQDTEGNVFGIIQSDMTAK